MAGVWIVTAQTMLGQQRVSYEIENALAGNQVQNLSGIASAKTSTPQSAARNKSACDKSLSRNAGPEMLHRLTLSPLPCSVMTRRLKL
jgi:hypothetical protein